MPSRIERFREAYVKQLAAYRAVLKTLYPDQTGSRRPDLDRRA